VVVSNTAGSVTSSAATLTVNPAPVAPTITTQPANETAILGQTTTFTVVAAGTAPLNYQWQQNGINIPGATGTTYTTPSVTDVDNDNNYDVVVSNNVGKNISNAVILTVIDPPVITTQPGNQTVAIGQTATFSVMVAGTAPLNYQWQKDGVNIAGATSASYTTPATALADSGSAFSVVVTNTAGTTTSNTATLTVNNNGNGQQPGQLQLLSSLPNTNLRQMAFGPNGTIFAVGSSGVMETADGINWNTLPNVPQKTPFSVTTNLNGDLIVGTVDTTSPIGGGNASVWKFNNNTNNWDSTNVSETLSVSHLLMDASGAIISTGAWGGDVWKSTDGGASFILMQKNLLQTLTGTNGALWTAALSPDGKFIAGGEGHTAGYSTDGEITFTAFPAPSNPHGNLDGIGYSPSNGNNAGNVILGIQNAVSGLPIQEFVNGKWITGTGLPLYSSLLSNTATYNGNVYAIVGTDTSNTFNVFTSPDGLTWTPMKGLPSPPPGAFIRPMDVQVDPFNGNLYLLCATVFGPEGARTFSTQLYVLSSSAPLAPTITTQPVSQTVTAGQTATFTVTASGAVPLSYQWQKNGVDIGGATSASYTTPATVIADNGAQLTVVVSNTVGSATSNAATLTVNAAPVVPFITTQPADQTVIAGQTATFTVVAAGTAPLKYQWQENGVNVGANSPTFTTSATTIADDQASIIVTVSNVAGKDISSAATLTVNPATVAPTITTQPADQTVIAGQTATLSIVAAGTAPLKYQWQKNGANIAGATGTSYTTPATTVADSGTTFDVVVSNTAGTITSGIATLTVNPVPVAPTITTEPVNQTVTVGQTATFSVVAVGSVPLNYQWERNGIDIPGATSASYTTNKTTIADNSNDYVVRVNNSVGNTISNVAILTVNVPPLILTQPSNMTVTAGQTATFVVLSAGTAPLTYQWQRGGVNIAGATSASYTTPATALADSGSAFNVVVSNSAGTVTSNAATLTVNPAPVAPTITTQPVNQTVKVGQTATFTVAAAGAAPLHYQWQLNGVAIAGATGVSYTTPATTAADSGKRFNVLVSNVAGSVTSAPATLTVGNVSQVTYTITTSAGSNGSITPSGAIPVISGYSKTFTMIPNAGYEVGSVTVDGISVGAVNSYTFSDVGANHTISVDFILMGPPNKDIVNFYLYEFNSSSVLVTYQLNGISTSRTIINNIPINVDDGTKMTIQINPGPGSEIEYIYNPYGGYGITTKANESFTVTNIKSKFNAYIAIHMKKSTVGIANTN